VPPAALDTVAAQVRGHARPVALAVVPGVGVGLATEAGMHALAGDPAALVAAVEARLTPRWVWWRARTTAAPLVAAGVRPRICWDLAAVARLLHGGTRDDPRAVWAAASGLPLPPGQPSGADGTLLGLLDEHRLADEPVDADGHLSEAWAREPWASDPAAPGVLGRAARWAALALDVRHRQEQALTAVPDPRAVPLPPPLAVAGAHAESAAALLAVELEHRGLPVDRATAEALVTAAAGPRPATPADEQRSRAARDALVLRHLPGGPDVDLRNPAQVRGALRAVGIDLPDTRSWRLARYRAAHPVVEPLLAWRKAERIATTYGWGWLDTAVGPDGRLRGRWESADGASGRMTAQAGLHNLPAELRPAVAAEPGHVLVRADLGQVEPRVLAVVSGDEALAAATRPDDLYAPVARELGCDRPTAKVAVLAAMYGQTSGTAGAALRRLDAVYPRAMAHLRAAEAAGREGRDLRTWSGRLLPLAATAAAAPANGPGRGRFARNAVVQGAAAELFKAWAATVRTGLLRVTGTGTIVLCLHDELLLHVPAARADAAVALLHDALAATAARWAAGSGVRFVADVTVVRRWSDAKG
jgi:DNA polymerase-1